MNNDIEKNETLEGELGQETTPFYVAQFDLSEFEERGTLWLRNGQNKQFTLLGEILVIGQPDDEGKLIPTAFPRIALRSEPLDELGGSLLLASVTHKISDEFEPADIQARVYYPRLSDYEAACTESDADYPQLEKLGGYLTWNTADPSEDGAPQLQVSLELTQIIDEVEGQVQSFFFDSPVLPFQPLAYEADPASKANSLASCGSASAPGTPQTGNDHPVMELRLRFYAVNNIPNPTQAQKTTLENKVKPLIEGACEVWYKKGGILITPEPEITWGVSLPQNPGQKDPDFIEVYLLESLPGSGGGDTKVCGTNFAYILLEIGAAQNNKYLLAHELGHALGLYHPGDCDSCARFWQGSLNSIMVPSQPGQANSNRNPLNNIEIIEKGAFPLVPNVFRVAQPARKCRWNPDSDLPLMEFLWNSNLKLINTFMDRDPNSQKYTDGNPVFRNNVPQPANPQRGAGPNYLYVRLLDCQSSSKPVRVYFYLASPGQNLTHLNNSNGPHLTIDIPDNTPEELVDRPKTRFEPWTVPGGFPNSFQVFAVAVDNRGVPQASLIQQIINNPQTHTANDLLGLIAQADIHVIGGNLTIQPTLA